MSQTKVAITIEEGVLAKVDALVRRKVLKIAVAPSRKLFLKSWNGLSGIA